MIAAATPQPAKAKYGDAKGTDRHRSRVNRRSARSRRQWGRIHSEAGFCPRPGRHRCRLSPTRQVCREPPWRSGFARSARRREAHACSAAHPLHCEPPPPALPAAAGAHAAALSNHLLPSDQVGVAGVRSALAGHARAARTVARIRRHDFQRGIGPICWSAVEMRSGPSLQRSHSPAKQQHQRQACFCTGCASR